MSSYLLDTTLAGGDIYIYLPSLSTVLILGFSFFVPLLAPLMAIRNRKRAVVLFLISASIAGLVFGTSKWTALLLPGLAAWSALFLVFASFWLGTYKLGWPPIVATRPRSLRRRLTTVFIGCLLVATLDVAATLAFTVWRSTTNSLDCGGRRLFAQPVSSRHAVFTARLIRVGHTRKVSGKWVGDWAIGLVQDQFWGLPSWAPHFVLLTNNLFWEGETYFIDRGHASGFVTRLLPIVEAGPCSRTRPVVDATLDLRVLREAPSSNGVRIIGYARKLEHYRGGLTPPTAHTPFAGARISLTGSSGTTIATTDQEGIYEIDGLPPDDYTIRLALPDTQFADEGTVKKERIIRDSLIEQDFDVVWNGTIEGKVRDVRGSPAHVWLLLQDSERADVGPNTLSFLQNDKTGSFRIEKIPPGRYMLTINPYGPSEDCLYAPLYYPSAMRPEDARVLEITQGQHIKCQHIKNVNYTMSYL